MIVNEKESISYKKVSQWGKTVLLLSVVLILCYGLYYLVDYIWNGSFVNWFERNYIWTRTETDYLTNQPVLISEINWPKFKILILGVFCTGAVICAALTRFVSIIYGRRRAKEVISDSGKMIHSYMLHDQETDEVFPAEYAEIAVQMSQIKAKMMRHNQILKDEEKRKNDMITYLAHDLKTPLTSIIGYLSLLEEVKDMPKPQREKYTKIVYEKSLLLEKLIQEFFDITRYNLNQIVLEKETFDLSYMLIQMADEFYPMLQPKGNQIELELDSEIYVHGDVTKLARVFQNILKNAVSYSYPGTWIRISAKARGDEVYVCIENEGETVPGEKLQHIFEKFYRADESRSGNTGGAGLGLAIAREIVNLHEGSIEAVSDNERTTFQVIIPIGEVGNIVTSKRG